IGGFTVENGETVPTGSIELINMNAEPGNRVEPLVDADGNRVKLDVARGFHTASYRQEDDHIVVIGGVGGDGGAEALSSVELVRFKDGLSAGEVGQLNSPRAQHESIVLGEDRSPIWVIGGRGGSGARKSTVLVRAGPGGIEAEPLSESMEMNVGRYGMGAARVGPTQVVVCGGYTSTDGSNGAPTAKCQLGNRRRYKWSQTCSMAAPRGGIDLVALTQSRDLTVLGGRDGSGETVDTPTRIEYRSGQSPPYVAKGRSATMQRSRYGASVTHLPSGLILMTGGIGQVRNRKASLQNMEYYNPLDIVRARGLESTDNSSSGADNPNDSGG
ncbi:MAG: hypothetical protein ABEN55_02990, partial [Bradymonadaceae bacterium]